MYVQLFGAYVVGIEGQVVEVEVDISHGLPHFEIVGLPGSSLKEAKERVRSAIRNSGFTFPNKKITINLAPADLRKEGAYFDVAMALAILIADEQVSLTPEQLQRLKKTIFIGELALDGSTRRHEGIFPLLLSAKSHGFTHVFIPAANIKETSLIEDMQTVPIKNISHVLERVRFPEYESGKWESAIQDTEVDVKERILDAKAERLSSKIPSHSIEDIKGQEHVKRAMEVAAFGFHHVLMVGPPGSGKTMFARCFPDLLPPLNKEEMLEVVKIHSAAGLTGNDPFLPDTLAARRPFRAPHHTITPSGMLGGGRPVKPGEVSIAHCGVLFLDEFLEFPRAVIEGLREPLEDQHITITRHEHRYTFPTQFQLVLAHNPCPCGYYGYETEQHPCVCSAHQIERYRHKLSGPLYDRIDLHIDVPLMSYAQMTGEVEDETNPYTTSKIRARIKEGLAFKKERGGSAQPNGMLHAKQIRKECQLTKEAENMLKMAFEQLQFSARGYNKILRVARTIADLNQTELVDDTAVAEAIGYRSLDRGLSFF